MGARAAPSPLVSRRVRLVNAHTGETFEGTYRNDNGPIPTVMDELAVFMRDHHSGATHPIDPADIDFLAAVMDAVGQREATILSAYRTPETNAMLARTTFGVADNSQHLYGRALDITLPARLEEAMNAARAMQRGGVGWYPHSHFIHLDSGPVRNWTLDGSGLDRLLLELRRFILGNAPGPSAKIALPIGPARHPLTVRQRLSMQRALAKAEFLARR